jgi:hypothetical protein
MPSLDFLLQQYYNSSTPPEDKQKIIPDLSARLFKHAMQAIQARAAVHGESENESIKTKDGCIIRGFMQEYHSYDKSNAAPSSTVVAINQNSNAFYTGVNEKEADKLKIGHLQVLLDSKQQFKESDFQGFALISVANCGTLEIVNPYSNPNFYGTALVKNLWTTSIEHTQFIYAPVLNNTVYVELVKKYYQPELYRYASSSKHDAIDEFTPPYLRPARRTLLRFEAIKLYEKLATEVADLFLPEDRERVKIRILYGTVFRFISKLADNLWAWMQQLSKDSPAEPSMVIQYQELLDQISACFRDCIANVQEYINNLDSNPGWRFEQEFVRKEDNKKQMINLPLAETDRQSVLTKCFNIIKDIHQTLYYAQNFLNEYAGKQNSQTPKLILPAFTPLGPSGKTWSIYRDLIEFKDSLEKAISDKSIREKILASLNDVYSSGGKPLVILTDDQLLNIYKYVLKAIEDPQHLTHLEKLPREIDSNDMQQSVYFIRRKDTDKQDPQLLRTISICLNKNGFKLSLVPSRKAYDAQEKLHKFKGHEASVTAQFDITPNHVNHLDKMEASKSINLGAAKDAESMLLMLKQTVAIARKMGQQVRIGGMYHHWKMVAVIDDDYSPPLKVLQRAQCAAIRVTEAWAMLDLHHFIKSYLVENSDQYWAQDIDYLHAKASNNVQILATVKSTIVFRLIGDVLRDILKLHDEVKVVHNDVKPQNILIYSHDIKLRARLADFDMSKYMDHIQAGSYRLGATLPYTAPQVAGYTLTADNDFYPDLRENLQEQTLDKKKYIYASYGRELFLKDSDTKKNQKEYKKLKQDYKDDMFSLGVTLYIFITSHYPTDDPKLTGIAGGTAVPYMHTEQAYKSFPEYKELLEGLLRFDRDKRFSAQEALAAYNRIPPVPQPASGSKLTLTPA